MTDAVGDERFVRTTKGFKLGELVISLELDQAAPCDRGIVAAELLQLSPVCSKSQRIEERLHLRQVQMTPMDNEVVAFTGEGNKFQPQNAGHRRDGNAAVGFARLHAACSGHVAGGNAIIFPQPCVRYSQAAQLRVQQQPAS